MANFFGNNRNFWDLMPFNAVYRCALIQDNKRHIQYKQEQDQNHDNFDVTIPLLCQFSFSMLCFLAFILTRSFLKEQGQFLAMDLLKGDHAATLL